jgi:hypothetical protein
VQVGLVLEEAGDQVVLSADGLVGVGVRVVAGLSVGKFRVFENGCGVLVEVLLER